MEKVIERLRAMPENQQERLARFLLHELDEEVRWVSSTAEHESKLGGLVDQVLADDRDGKCEPLDPDSL